MKKTITLFCLLMLVLVQAPAQVRRTIAVLGDSYSTFQ